MQLTWLFIVHKLRVGFVYTEVRDVNEPVSYVCRVVAVLLGGKPHEALVIQVEPQRPDTGQQDIEAEVKLEVVYEEGPLQVLLHHHLVLLVRQVGCNIRRS